ncbi:hypothetical protein FS842_002687 [Serendipita sp. 407]|nr:hypothetical protein FS842_002687 [Serendipita sp. 407]
MLLVGLGGGTGGIENKFGARRDVITLLRSKAKSKRVLVTAMQRRSLRGQTRELGGCHGGGLEKVAQTALGNRRAADPLARGAVQDWVGVMLPSKDEPSKAVAASLAMPGMVLMAENVGVPWTDDTWWAEGEQGAPGMGACPTEMERGGGEVVGTLEQPHHSAA